MEKIASFAVDHLRLLPGLYVSRVDRVPDGCVTTFDLRITRPNFEPVMGTEAVHAMEHLGATYLRNHPLWKQRIVYFGPMGCRTGFYLLVSGECTPEEILPLLKETFLFIRDYSGEIPGQAARDCGNFLDMHLMTAQYYARKYLEEFLLCPVPQRMEYPKEDV